MTFRASLVSFTLLATVLSALAASGSPVVGREELRLAPLYVGIPILIIGAAVELLRRLSSSRIAGRLATLARAVASGITVFRLALGYFTPPAGRNIETRHLWPLFTALQIVALAGPILLAAITVAIATYIRMRRLTSA